MKVKRDGPSDRGEAGRDKTPTRGGGRRRAADGPVRAARRPADAPPRGGRPRGAKAAGRTREPRGKRPGPQTAPVLRPADRPARPKNTDQAKARAKARKAKAPKAVRVPLRERLIARLSTVDLRPRTLAAKVPFVVLVIGSLGLGLGVTLWLSTYSAERSYQLGTARHTNEVLSQQKEALERDVLEAQAAPALAEAARNLGMIPSKDTAHLVQDPAGNWVVVGTPKPAQGALPPPLNNKLPDEKPAPPAPTVPKPTNPVEVPVQLPPMTGAAVLPGIEVPVRTPGATPLGTPHAPAGATAPGPADAAPVPGAGPAPGPVPAPALAPLPAGAPVPVDAAPAVQPAPAPVASPPAAAVSEQFTPIVPPSPGAPR
jgi:hypothetical protein